MKAIRVIIGLVVLMISMSAMAQKAPRNVPAIRTPIERVQPDGDTLVILLRGDEWHHWMMTTDGWLVREDNKGVICYMQKDKRETAVLSKRQAHNADKRGCCEKKWLKRHGMNRQETR